MRIITKDELLDNSVCAICCLKRKKSTEHVIPKWLLDENQLRNSKSTYGAIFGDSEIKIDYGKSGVKICVNCNNLLGKTESRIKDDIATEEDYVIWALKIYSLMFLKSELRIKEISNLTLLSLHMLSYLLNGKKILKDNYWFEIHDLDDFKGFHHFNQRGVQYITFRGKAILLMLLINEDNRNVLVKNKGVKGLWESIGRFGMYSSLFYHLVKSWNCTFTESELLIRMNNNVIEKNVLIFPLAAEISSHIWNDIAFPAVTTPEEWIKLWTGKK